MARTYRSTQNPDGSWTTSRQPTGRGRAFLWGAYLFLLLACWLAQPVVAAIFTVITVAGLVIRHRQKQQAQTPPAAPPAN